MLKLTPMRTPPTVRFAVVPSLALRIFILVEAHGRHAVAYGIRISVVVPVVLGPFSCADAVRGETGRPSDGMDRDET